MKSLERLGSRPVSLPLAADDVIEFHMARLLLLLKLCGTAGRIDGLTKMAKLDFFVRYPDFFNVARDQSVGTVRNDHAVESAMVRHHYGPWDKRYYHVLANLEAKGLISVTKEKSSYQIALTELGQSRAKRLLGLPSFEPIVDRMKDVKRAFGSRSGSSLKQMIYKVFDEEVGQRRLGEVIKA